MTDRNDIAEARGRTYLLREVTEHQMTVLLDQGLYRHVRFARPGTDLWRFDLVTWPGHLAISGDIGDYVFARLPDMFEFFAGNPDRGVNNPGLDLRINAHYWHEKLVAPREALTYSSERLRGVVTDLYNEAVEDGLIPRCDAAPIWHDIEQDVLSEEYDETLARQAAEAFDSLGFGFSDVWEWDLRDFDWRYLLCCWAIVWGIAKYREKFATVKVLREVAGRPVARRFAWCLCGACDTNEIAHSNECEATK